MGELSIYSTEVGGNEFSMTAEEEEQQVLPEDEKLPLSNEAANCDEVCQEYHNLMDQIDEMVTLYGLIPLCTIGIIFNFASIGALFNNTLHLRRSLIQLFIFLNSSDV